MKIKVNDKLTITAKHLWAKDGVYYYRRRYPPHVAAKVGSNMKHVRLDTNDPIAAANEAHRIAAIDDAEWFKVQRAQQRMHPTVPKTLEEADMQAAPVHTGSDVRDFYIKMRGGDPNFDRLARIAFSRLLEKCGNKAIQDYRRAELNDFVAILLAGDVRHSSVTTSTVRRRLKTLSAAFTLFIVEHELDLPNPFTRLMIPNEAEDTTRRVPFEPNEVLKLREHIASRDDDLAHILGLLLDTGARLAEVVGLAFSDVVLKGPIPHIHIRYHPWRRLKKGTAQRKVPLAGQALDSARKMVERAKGPFLFPRYTTEEGCNATSASATLNKRVRSLGIDKTCHCLRHTMRDRLRAVGCPQEVAKQIMGWSSTGTDERYGRGFELAVLQSWLTKT